MIEPRTPTRSRSFDTPLSGGSKRKLSPDSISPHSILSTPKRLQLDRFIANRQNTNYEAVHAELVQEIETYNKRRRSPTSFEIVAPKIRRIVDVFEPPLSSPSSSHALYRGLPEGSEHLINTHSSSIRKKIHMRTLSTRPFRVLDAPDLVDDYYLNLLTWSQNNIIAIALQGSVYLWNANTLKTDILMSLPDGDGGFITSVQWSTRDPHILAVGTNTGHIQLWDSEANNIIRDVADHRGRVPSLSWNDSVISSGGRDCLITHHDTRAPRMMNKYVYILLLSSVHTSCYNILIYRIGMSVTIKRSAAWPGRLTDDSSRVAGMRICCVFGMQQ